MSRAGNVRSLNLIPWTSGYSMFGHPAVKRENGLQLARNQVRDFDGTFHRRGGQRNYMRSPIYEGQAFSTHFLNATLSESWTWTLGSSAATYSLNTASLLQLKNTNNVGATLEFAPVDTITTVTTSTSVNIVYRMKLSKIGALLGGGSFSIEVDDGTNWRLWVRFADDGIGIYDGASFEDIHGASGVTNHLSAGDSSDYIHTNWMNWRWTISRSGADFKAALYLEEVLVYSGYTLPASNAETVKLTIQGDVAGNDIDVTLDNLEIDAGVKEIRGLHEFRNPTESPVSVRRLAIYAGTRVYLCDGDIYRLVCIDDGITEDQLCSFENFNGKLCYVTTDGSQVRRYAIGDRRGEVISGSPNLTMLRAHTGRLFGAGNPANKSQLYWCGLTDETTWNDGTGSDFTNAGFTPINSDDGEKITAIGQPFMKTLPIYKEGSIYRLDGTSPTNFSVNPITSEIGAVSHFAVVNVVNDQYFLSRYGIHSLIDTDRFGELAAGLISKELQTIWRRDVNRDRLDLAWAVNNEELDRFEVFVPTYEAGEDGITPNRIFVLHYGVRTEEFPQGLWTDKRVTGRCMARSKLTGLPEFRIFVGREDGYFAIQDEVQVFDFPEYAA